MKRYPVNWITNQLAVGYAPRSHSDLDVLRKQGVDAIVNLCAECYDLSQSEKNAGFDVHYVPVPDEAVPTLEDLEKSVAWIEDNIQAGKKVLVHCRFGVGRTGTLVAAYLLSKGNSIKAALRKMKHTPSIPVSRQQWDMLARYSAKLGVSVAGISELQVDDSPQTDTFFKKWDAMLDFFK